MVLHLWGFLGMVKESRVKAEGVNIEQRWVNIEQRWVKVEQKWVNTITLCRMLKNKCWLGREEMPALGELHRKQPPRLHRFALFDACFDKQKEQWVVSGTPEELRQWTQAANASAGMEQQLLPSEVRFTLKCSSPPLLRVL